MMSNNLLKINKLYLDNYRCFKDFTIDFHDQLTVLVATNGKGKTAILDAIAVAFGTFVNSTGLARGSVFHRSDVQKIKARETKTNEMEEVYPLVLEANGLINNEDTHWSRELHKPKGATTTKDTKPLIQYGQDIRKKVVQKVDEILPLISYYGTGRLWGLKKITLNKKQHETSRLSGYIDCLDPLSSYKSFESWYVDICLAELELKIEEIEKNNLDISNNEFTVIRKSIQQAVNHIVEKNTGWKDIVYKKRAETIVAQNETFGELSLMQLSDGIRNMIGLVADIAYRAVKLNPHLENAPKQTPGIVLIDEVDMHLHPKWQQTVLTDLTKAFPNIQFIVTTHSPQVLSTVKKEQIRILGENVVSTPSTYSFGEDSSVLLAELMNVSPLPPLEIVEKRKEYQRLIEDREYESPRAKQLQKELIENYGENSEFIIQTEMLIRRFEALKKVGK
ncbi:AAA family ATPase [Aliarcobacter butzleri]|uniref:AAA family ATPase n=1 Tax=Aliarcobacter butzleri TaxID=28197 RepID=UPI0021B4FD93|nr:AAA family ATPase [Aliarcobacter butzleri]MCT7650879.1 AAA family ATPase [Aliarcobacter butzleri]